MLFQEERKNAEARDAGLVSSKKTKTPVKQLSSSSSNDTSALFENIEDSTASRTFAASPSTEKSINSFIQAFGEDDSVIEDLQPLHRISRGYRSDNR